MTLWSWSRKHPIWSAALTTGIFFLLFWLFQYVDNNDASKSAFSALIASAVFFPIYAVTMKYYYRDRGRNCDGDGEGEL